MLAHMRITVWCLAALGAFGSFAETEGQWQPTPLPLDTAFTETQPSRALRETYGYDWRVRPRVLVAWPATKPVRERSERPALEEELWADSAPREPLVVAKPTPVAELLAALLRP